MFKKSLFLFINIYLNKTFYLLYLLYLVNKTGEENEDKNDNENEEDKSDENYQPNTDSSKGREILVFSSPNTEKL